MQPELRVLGVTRMEVLPLARLPKQPNFEHLRKQAKDLLRLYEANDAAAFERFRQYLPAAAEKDDAAIAAMALKLHDAQSCIAREYGLPNWQNLRNYVDFLNSRFSKERKHTAPLWLHGVYGHDGDHPQPTLAARVLADNPDLIQDDLYLACAAGEEKVVRQAIAADPACVHRTASQWRCPGCNKILAMPPLIAVTHSTLIQLPEFQDRLLRCARLLLDAGADVNQPFVDGEHTLSPLYGAAGKNQNAEMTKLLLDAGANPEDGESLYHSMEEHGRECARLLLQAGAKIEGTNALHHSLDQDDIEKLKLLLSYTKDANDSGSGLGSPLLWAIRRGRSRAHMETLLAAGADPHARTKDGVSAYGLALQMGLADVAELLAAAGAGEPLSVEENFVAACARCDEREARRILSEYPNMFDRLSEPQLRQLPNLTEAGNKEAVRLMVRLGWPIAVTGGDWKASALNLAVYQGDADLTRFLLENGASWTERQGFDDNVHGTLCWASRNMDPANDYVGCARALIDHGLPILELDGDYSEEVAEFIESERKRLGA